MRKQSNQKRILIITHRAYPVIGGIENHVYKAGKFLSQKGDLVIQNLAFTNDSPEFVNVEDKFSIKTIYSKFIFKDAYPIPFPWQILKFINAIVSFKPDIIHTHNRYMTSTFIAQVYGLLSNTPVIHTEHSGSPIIFKSPIFQLIGKLIDGLIVKILLPQSKAVTGVSNATRRYLKAHFNLENIKVIYNFLDTKEIDDVIGKERKFPALSRDKRIKVLFIYRLVESKGYKQFLELSERFNKDKRFTFVIAGDGQGKEDVEKFLTQSKRSNLKYLGGLSHEDALSLINQCQIIVNFSEQEGLPTTLMEARYLGKKVLASGIDPNREVLKGYEPHIITDLDINSLEKSLKLLDGLTVNESDKSFNPKFEMKSALNAYYRLYWYIIKQSKQKSLLSKGIRTIKSSISGLV